MPNLIAISQATTTAINRGRIPPPGLVRPLDLLQVYLLVVKTREGKRRKGKRKNERKKDRLVTLVHPIEATFEFSYSPDNILYGEGKFECSLDWVHESYKSIFPSLLCFPFSISFISRSYDQKDRLVASPPPPPPPQAWSVSNCPVQIGLREVTCL